MDSVFTCLYRYKKPEDYLTRSLVFILELLRSLDANNGGHSIANTALNTILSSRKVKIRLSKSHWKIYQNKTFPVPKSGRTVRPDITLIDPKNLIFVEVKDWSQTGPSQLKDQRVVLDHEKTINPGLNTILVLLCRWTTADEKERQHITREIFWYQVHEDLLNARKLIPPRKAVECYLLRDFLSFMEAEGMTI